MSASELATAYVTLLPRLTGAQKSIEGQLSGVNLAPAGVRMGQSLSGGINAGLGAAAKAVSAAGGLLDRTFTRTAKVGVGAIAGIGTAVAGLAAKGGLTRALNLEKAQTMFKGLKLEWSDYESTINAAVDGTIYSLDAAAVVAASLAASGVGAGDAMETALNGCVGAASTFGLELDNLGYVYQKVAAKGKMQGDEMMLLTERGIPALQLLSQHLGKTTDEVQEMVKKGEVSFEIFSDAMYAAFGDSAQAANETFTGSMANMRSALSRIGADFMTPVKDSAIPVFNSLRVALNSVRARLQPLAGAFSEVASRVSGEVAAALGRFSEMLQKGASLSWALKAAIDGAFGNGTMAGVAQALSLFGGLAALGPALKAAGAGMSAVSAAVPAISGAAAGVASVTRSLSGLASMLGGSLLAAVRTFGSTLLHGLVPPGAASAISRLSTDLAYGLRDCKASLIANLGAMRDAVTSRLAGIGSAMSDALGGVPGAVGNAFSTMGSYIGEAAGNAADAFRARFNIGSHAQGEGSALSAALGKVKGALGSIAGPVASATAGLAMVSGGLLAAGLAAVAAGVDLQGACDSFLANIQGITANMPVMAQQFADILPGMVEQVAAAVPALVESFTVAINSLVEVFPVVLPVIVQALTDMIVQLAPVLVSLIPVLLDAGLQLFTALLNSLDQILPVLIAMMPQMVDQVCTVLINNLPLLLSAGLTLFTSLVTAFIQMLPQLIGKLPDLINRTTSTLIGFLPTLGQAAGQLFGAIVEAVPGILGALLSAIGDLLSNLPGAVSGFASSMATAAGDMIRGMVSGIRNAAGAVWDAIKNVCSNALGAVKSFFGIASPSKVMRKMFGFVGEGMALGLEDSAPQVLGSMMGLVSGAEALAAGFSPALDVSPALAASASAGAYEAVGYSTAVPPAGAGDDAVGRLLDAVLELRASLGGIIADNAPVVVESERDWQRRVRRAVA